MEDENAGIKYFVLTITGLIVTMLSLYYFFVFREFQFNLDVFALTVIFSFLSGMFIMVLFEKWLRK